VSDTDLPTLNVALLEECLKWAEFSAGTEGNPAWYQASWVSNILGGDQRDSTFEFGRRIGAAQFEENYCGTAYCMAGYALQQTGNLVTVQMPHLIDGVANTQEPKNEIVNERGECLSMAGRRLDWNSAGGHVLGLSYREAHAFFDGDNTLEKLKAFAAAFAERRGVPIHIEGEVKDVTKKAYAWLYEDA
jgi:hypothetical protein